MNIKRTEFKGQTGTVRTTYELPTHDPTIHVQVGWVYWNHPSRSEPQCGYYVQVYDLDQFTRARRRGEEAIPEEGTQNIATVPDLIAETAHMIDWQNVPDLAINALVNDPTLIRAQDISATDGRLVVKEILDSSVRTLQSQQPAREAKELIEEQQRESIVQKLMKKKKPGMGIW